MRRAILLLAMAMVNNPATSDGNFPAPGKDVSLETRAHHINTYLQVVQCGAGKTQNMSVNVWTKTHVFAKMQNIITLVMP